MLKKLIILLCLSLTAAASGWWAWKVRHPSRHAPRLDVAKAESEFRQHVLPFLNQYCWDCHADGEKKGDLALDPFTNVTEILNNRRAWEHVLLNVKNGEMPPKKKKTQPSPEERERLTAWIEKTLFPIDPEYPDPGRVTIRRLNRNEYNNTVRDLLGVDVQPADDFPQDDVGYGFDNIGDVLSLPPILFEKYLRAADRILDEALITGPKDPKWHIFKADDFKGGERRPDGRKVDYEGKFSAQIKLPEGGDYKISFVAGAILGNEEPVLTQLAVDDGKSHEFAISASRETMATFEQPMFLKAGDHEVRITVVKASKPLPKTEVKTRGKVEKKTVERKLVVNRIEVIGPFTTNWPAPTPSHRRVFFKPHSPGKEMSVARDILDRFATRAFRRPATESELDRLTTLVQTALKNGDNFETGIRVACTAVLVSPAFLFRGELQSHPDDPLAVHPVNEFALASRLSYFLWSSMPDDRLFELARKGKLRKNLQAEVRRMLADPKSDALVRNFAGQWLQLGLLEVVSPNRDSFPEFSPGLRSSMRRETEELFTYILRNNRPVLEFLNADYSFVDETLARHYGIPGVTGPDFVRVSTQGTPRGGLLSQGAVLTLTSNPTRTSPVKRGKYVLDNLLGTPPPPPPPNVPELKEEGKELTGTLRQRLEKHRADPMCSSCHERMDPIGFALEHFDAVGKWRETDGGHAIEPAGTLVSGETFASAEDLKRILVSSRKKEFLRCLSEKLMTYALGRGLEYYDKPAVDKIIQSLESNGYPFSALIQGVVDSVPFQNRRGDGDPSAATARLDSK